MHSFSDLFTFLLYVLTIGLLILVIYFSYRSIKEQIVNIGILKSLGTLDKKLLRIFSVRIFIMMITSALFYLLTAYTFIGFCNTLLIKALRHHTYLDPKINLLILFDIRIVLFNIFIFLLIGLVSYLFVLIKLKKVSPINIIKAKE